MQPFSYARPAPPRPAGQTVTTLDPPEHLTPEDGAVVTAGDVAFAWTPMPGAAEWSVELASDAGMSLNLAPGPVVTTPAFTTSLAPGTYYWRVQSGRAPGTVPDDVRFSPSSALKLTVVAAPAPTPPPTVPHPLSPGNGSLLAERSVTVRWLGDATAEAYEVQVCRVEGGRSWCRTETLAGIPLGAVAGAEYSMPVALDAPGDYFWQVRTRQRGTGLMSAFSPSQAFRVAAPTPVVVPTVVSPVATATGFHVPGVVWLAGGVLGGYLLLRALGKPGKK